ncbi:uncharacterized protein GWK60_E01287 [Nakaseomyces glabratus]|nr:6-phosphofructo-2-kinase [Nakaseomyces glabratus]QNG13105.1 uncharacterized protein GWK60_E01287 [Nakaseomyces glabratus]
MSFKMQELSSAESSTNSLFSMKSISSMDISRNTTPRPSPLGAAMSTNDQSFLSLASIRREMDRESKKDKFIVILVGLPASGKSSISSHLIQSLKNNTATAHLRSTVYNAGKVRRMLCNGEKKKSIQIANDPSEDLFNPANAERKEVYAKITLENLINELDSDICDFAIFDATNSTVQRRSFVFREIYKYNDREGANFNLIPIVFQVTCSNQDFIRYNIHNKTFNEDYFDKPYEVAVQDFSKRLKYYHSQFVPFTETEFNTIIESNSSQTAGKPSLYYYNILNAGLDPSKQFQLSYTRESETHSMIVKETLRVISHFVTNYSELYGYSYINRVKNFFGESINTVVQKPSWVANYIPGKLSTWDYSNKLRHLASLKKIVNNDYFNELNSIIN